MGCYFVCVFDGWVIPVVHWLALWDHLQWWESELDLYGRWRIITCDGAQHPHDGLVVGTFVSGIASNRGRSTLGDGVPVVGGGGALCWRVDRRILRSCWMAWACAMDSLVEDGTVPPRAVSVSVAWMIVSSVSEIVGVAQCVGKSRQVSATRYCRVPGM